MIEATETHDEMIEEQSAAMRRGERTKALEHALDDIAHFENNGIYQEIIARLNAEYSKAFNDIIVLSRNGRREEAAHLIGMTDGLGMAMGMLRIIEADINRELQSLYEEGEA